MIPRCHLLWSGRSPRKSVVHGPRLVATASIRVISTSFSIPLLASDGWGSYPIASPQSAHCRRDRRDSRPRDHSRGKSLRSGMIDVTMVHVNTSQVWLTLIGPHLVQAERMPVFVVGAAVCDAHIAKGQRRIGRGDSQRP